MGHLVTIDLCIQTNPDSCYSTLGIPHPKIDLYKKTQTRVIYTKAFHSKEHFLSQESDLTFRLASGLVIWQPMWEHRQPDIPAFTALIKPVRNIVTGKKMI